MGTISSQTEQALLRLLTNSKQTSELVEEPKVLRDKLVVVQSGVLDATGVRIGQSRGYLGTYNASINQVTLQDSTVVPMDSDAIATPGDWVVVSVGGTQDFGSGNITVIAGDRLRHDGQKWYKESESGSNLVVPENGQLLIKRDGKTGTNLQTGDLVAWKVVDLNGSPVTITGAKYLGGDANLYQSYAPGLHVYIDGQRFNYTVGMGNSGNELEVGDIASSGVFSYNGTNFFGDLILVDASGDTSTGIGTKWEIINRTQI